MKYGSVCSGIEAATQAWHPLGWTPAFFSEIEKFPSAVLAHHYGSNMPGEDHSKNGVPNYGDMTNFQEWPDHAIDLLVGGTPCQSFSIAGLRKGLDDPRGNLMLTYLAIARRYQPKWLVWENVPGVLSSNGGRDFGTFIRGLEECGYHAAWRVLDAQYVRVDGFGRAVPQRRRRIFVVGYLGDWRRAAAVLFERESLSGHPSPRREQGKRVAPTIASRPTGGVGLGTDFDLDGGLIHQAFGGNNTSGPINVATAINAHGGPAGRLDFESETFVAHPLLGKANSSHDDTLETYIAFDCKASGRNGFSVGSISPTLRSMGYLDSHQNAGGQVAVAHSLRAEGFDASEDGTGRGTPIVPICFDTTQITSKANYSNPQIGDPCHPLASGAHPPAVVWSIMPQNSGKDYKARQVDVAQPIMAGGPVGGNQGGDYIQQQWAVRRLTPTECERLQGFPDGYTLIPVRKTLAADGPRYKALGNSMAINCMRWIGQRIQTVEAMSEKEMAA